MFFTKLSFLKVNMDDDAIDKSSSEELHVSANPDVVARSKDSSPKLGSEHRSTAGQENMNAKSKGQLQGSVKLRDEKGACSSSRPGSGKSKGKSSGSFSTIHFFSGNPAVENTEGIIHLYKNKLV